MLAFIMEDLEDVALDRADKVRVVSRLFSLSFGPGAPGATPAHSLSASFDLCRLDPASGSIRVQMSETECGQFPQRGSEKE